MKKLFQTSISLYFHNFWLFFVIISPLVIPVVVLRIAMRYMYLGNLTLIYSILFGFILSIIGIFVEYILIKTSYELLVPATVPFSIKKKWAEAKKQFWPFLFLKILVSIIVISLPFLLGTILNALKFGSLISTLGLIINLAWLVIMALLFLFSSYALIIEKLNLKKALGRSLQLIKQQPITTTLSFIVILIAFGIILVLLASITQVVIAMLTGTLNILTNEYMSLWWESLVQQIYLFISLPFIVCLTTVLYHNLTKKNET